MAPFFVLGMNTGFIVFFVYSLFILTWMTRTSWDKPWPSGHGGVEQLNVFSYTEQSERFETIEQVSRVEGDSGSLQRSTPHLALRVRAGLPRKREKESRGESKWSARVTPSSSPHSDTTLNCMTRNQGWLLWGKHTLATKAVIVYSVRLVLVYVKKATGSQSTINGLLVTCIHGLVAGWMPDLTGALSPGTKIPWAVVHEKMNAIQNIKKYDLIEEQQDRLTL